MMGLVSYLFRLFLKYSHASRIRTPQSKGWQEPKEEKRRSEKKRKKEDKDEASIVEDAGRRLTFHKALTYCWMSTV